MKLMGGGNRMNAEIGSLDRFNIYMRTAVKILRGG